MSLLQIYLPEHADQQAASYLWALRDAQGAIRHGGVATLNELPTADRVELVAPASRVFLTQIALPAGSRQKLRRMLPYAVEDKVTTDPEKTHVVAGPRLADGQTAVAVVDKAWIGAVLTPLRSARVKPQAMWIETLLPGLTAGSWVAVWKNNEGFLRSGPASGFFLDGALDDAPPVALQLALHEARADGTAPERIVVRPARGATLPQLPAWSDRLQIEIVAGERWDWFERAKDGINLLQDDLAPAGAGSDMLPRLRPAFVLLGLIAAVYVVSAGLDWFSLNRQKNQLQTTMNERFLKAFPEAKVVQDAPLQMRRNLEDLRRGAGQADASDFLPLLARTTKLIEASANHRLRGLDYRAGELKVDVALPDSAAADKLKDALQAPDLRVKLDAVNPATGEGGGVVARFSVASAKAAS